MGWLFPSYDSAAQGRYPFPSATAPSSYGLRWSTAISGQTTVLTGDLDGDGNLEIVALEQSSSGEVVNVYDHAGNLLWTKTYADPVSDPVLVGGAVGDTTNHGAFGDVAIVTVPGSTSLTVVVSFVDSSSNMKADFLDANGSLIKEVTRGTGTSDAMWGLFGVDGDNLYFWCNSGYDLINRGLSIVSYSTGTEIANYFEGSAQRGTIAAAPIAGGAFGVAMGSSTVNNGNCANGSCDNALWAILLNGSGALVNQTSSLSPGASSVSGTLWPMITSLDGSATPDTVLWFEEHDPTYYQGTSTIHVSDLNGNWLASVAGDQNANWTAAVGFFGGPNLQLAASDTATETIQLYGMATGMLSTFASVLSSAAGAGQVLATNDLYAEGEDQVIAYQSSSGNLRVLNADLSTQLFSQNIGALPNVAISDIDNDGVNEIVAATSTTLYVFGTL